MNGQGTRVSIPNAPLPGAQYVEDLFVYQVDVTNIAAATGTAQANVTIQADSDFKLVKLAQFCNNHASITNLTASTQPLPLVTLQITDNGSGRNLFSGPVPIPALFGNGSLPFILPISRIFKASSTITIALANYDSALAYDIHLSLIGTKLFRMG